MQWDNDPGPDGDLGSNEIKISKDQTIGIVDGSGVLYDPDGIDKEVSPQKSTSYLKGFKRTR